MSEIRRRPGLRYVTAAPNDARLLPVGNGCIAVISPDAPPTFITLRGKVIREFSFAND